MYSHAIANAWQGEVARPAGTPGRTAAATRAPANTPIPPAPGDIREATARLGAEWSKRRNGSPTVEAMTRWLLQDYRDTLEGARRRWKNKFTADAIGRAWIISREQQMRFQGASTRLPHLANVNPPSQRVKLVSSPLIQDSNTSPVAPVVVRFVQELRRRYPGFAAWNYPNHGGGRFMGRGYSLDFSIQGRDARGFYPPAEALKFLRAVREAAGAVNAEWRVLYNDFTVADAVNRQTGKQHVLFMGTTRKTGTRVTGLNWHGPHPLILHFHLDLAPRSPEQELWAGETNRWEVGW